MASATSQEEAPVVESGRALVRIQFGILILAPIAIVARNPLAWNSNSYAGIGFFLLAWCVVPDVVVLKILGGLLRGAAATFAAACLPVSGALIGGVVDGWVRTEASVAALLGWALGCGSMFPITAIIARQFQRPRLGLVGLAVGAVEALLGGIVVVVTGIAMHGIGT